MAYVIKLLCLVMVFGWVLGHTGCYDTDEDETGNSDSDSDSESDSDSDSDGDDDNGNDDRDNVDYEFDNGDNNTGNSGADDWAAGTDEDPGGSHPISDDFDPDTCTQAGGQCVVGNSDCRSLNGTVDGSLSCISGVCCFPG